MAASFQPKFVDLVRNYSSTVGTDDFVLGPAVNGYTDFSAALQPGDRFYYSAIGVDNPAETEVGRGTLTGTGTISRDPISGTKTNFSSGTKSIGLVAAADWFTAVGASAGVSSRSAMAALVATDRSVLLTEAGREGHFMFDPADLSAEVAGDPNQGIYVAPASDPTGASGAWVRKFSGAIDVRWFGAVGDGVTDDYAAVQGAINLSRPFSGSVYVPATAARYRISQRLEITTAIHLYGDTPVQDARALSHPEADIGSTLYFDAGVGGFLLQYINENDRGGPTTYVGSTTAVIERLKIMSAGGGVTSPGLYGVEIRAPITMRNVEVTFFPDHGIYENASLGPSTNAYGDANGTYYEKCKSNGNGGDGFRIEGADTNVTTLMNCSAAGNVGYAITDGTLIGLCAIGFIFENGNGAAQVLNDGAPSTYLACEWEAGTSVLGSSTTVIGGNYGQATPHSPTTPAFIMSAGRASGKEYMHFNAGGPTAIGCRLGHRGVDMAAFSFGINAALDYTDWAFKYGPRNDQSWGFQCNGSTGEVPLMFPDGVNRTGRNFAAELPQGICIGTGAGGIGPVTVTGTAAPTTGTWQQGDLVINSAPATGGVFAWRCTTAGTPGTWEAVSALGSNVKLTTSSGWNTGASATFGYNSSDGAWITGNGASFDFVVYDSAGAAVFQAPHGGNDIRTSRGILSSSPTTGMGYRTGAGGTVTQATSKSTGVTLNKVCGEVTMNAAALAAGTSVSFVLTNSAIAAGDNLILNHVATGTFGAYAVNGRCAAGSATIDVRNISGAALSEAIVLRFTVMKSVTA